MTQIRTKTISSTSKRFGLTVADVVGQQGAREAGEEGGDGEGQGAGAARVDADGLGELVLPMHRVKGEAVA